MYTKRTLVILYDQAQMTYSKSADLRPLSAEQQQHLMVAASKDPARLADAWLFLSGFDDELSPGNAAFTYHRDCSVGQPGEGYPVLEVFDLPPAIQPQAPYLRAALVGRTAITSSDPSRIARIPPGVCRTTPDGSVNRTEVSPMVQAINQLIDAPELSPEATRQFAIDCAARVLPIFEKALPGHTAPQAALEAARRFLSGDCNVKDLKVAGLRVGPQADVAESMLSLGDLRLAAASAAWSASAAAGHFTHGKQVDAKAASEHAWQALAYLVGYFSGYPPVETGKGKDRVLQELSWQLERLQELIHGQHRPPRSSDGSRVLSPLVKKLLPLLNKYGIPVPTDEAAWRRLPGDTPGAVFTKEPWIGPQHHLQVAAFTGDSGNLVLSLKTCDNTGKYDDVFTGIVSDETRLEPALKKLHVPMVRELRQRFGKDKLPQDFGVRKELAPDGTVLQPTLAPDGQTPLDVETKTVFDYRVEFDALRLYGTIKAVPAAWFPPGTQLPRQVFGSRLVSATARSPMYRLPEFETALRARLARIPLASEPGKSVADVLVSVQDADNYVPTDSDVCETAPLEERAGNDPR